MADEPLLPFVIAMVFGEPPNLVVKVGATMAVNQTHAVANILSWTYVEGGMTQHLNAFEVANLAPEFIAAAHRGTTGPAPVVSLVPSPGGLEGMRAELIAAAPEAYAAGQRLMERDPDPPPDGAA